MENNSRKLFVTFATPQIKAVVDKAANNSGESAAGYAARVVYAAAKKDLLSLEGADGIIGMLQEMKAKGIPDEEAKKYIKICFGDVID